MKRFRSIVQPVFVMTALFAAVLLLVGGSYAQAVPLEVYLSFSKPEFNLDDPAETITAVIRVRVNQRVLARKGFQEQVLPTFVVFKGPDDKIFTYKVEPAGPLPAPKLPPAKIAVEEIDPSPSPYFQFYTKVVEMRDFLPLDQPGDYLGWVSMPYVFYDPADKVIIDGKDYVYGHKVPVSHGHVESTKVPIVLKSATGYVTSGLKIRCREFIFGEGSHPGVTKKPCGDIQVRLYKRSYIEQNGISPINHQTCAAIATLDQFRVALETETPGEYFISGVEQDHYIILGYAAKTTDYKHLWSPIDAADPGWESGDLFKNLIVMTDNRGKKSVGKSKKVKGSELLIIEPEYVEWTSNEEFYPFAFESLETWDVEVAVAPPEGFVADNDSLSESVSSDLRAVQFTLTDVGTKWKPMKVKYKVKHKGKVQHIESKIKVKLSKKLAKQKGVSEWGE